MTARAVPLSADFTYKELFGAHIVRPHQVAAAVVLCASVLQPIRNVAGRIDITRGYSTAAENAAVNGSPSSAHLYQGEPDDPLSWNAAADINLLDMHGNENAPGRFGVALLIEAWLRNAAGEFIWYTYTNHWHVAMRNRRNVGELMVSTSPKKYIRIATIAEIKRYDPRLA